MQGLSAEEQETQREEWKAELSKTEEEILTLKQVLASKERHAAGQYSRSGPALRGMLQVSTQGPGQQGEACCRSVQQVLASKKRHAVG